MSSTISTSDIRNVHIFNRDSQELGLCRKHQRELRNSIADRLDELVTSQFFQTQFSEFLPPSDSNEEVNVRIHVSDGLITVQQIDPEGNLVGNAREVELDAINDMDERDIEDAEGIS